MPFVVLKAADEKNRQGATIPLRADLANDLKLWLSDIPKLPTLRLRFAYAIPRGGRTASDRCSLFLPDWSAFLTAT